MGTLTADQSKIIYNSDGSHARRDVVLGFSSSYNNTGNDATTGETLTAASVGLTKIFSVQISEDSGYGFEALGLDSADPKSSCRIKAFQGGSGTTGATSGGTPAAQTFTGANSALNLATPAFSGTGLTAAGQVMTTGSTHTMTLNQCAGMWLVPATGSTPPMLILSNTAVAGAPAVLTVQGAASTDAGAYKIVATLPVGSNGASAALATHTHTVGATAGGEVANGTNLSVTLAAVKATVFGY